MSTITLSTMAAVNGTENSMLGYLTWNSVGEQLVSHDKLVDLFTQYGLDIGMLPSGVRPQDAFRRATSKKRSITTQEGIRINYFAKEVIADKEKVIRHIVAETVDSKGVKLEYEPQAAILSFNKETHTINSFSFDKVAEEMTADMQRDYEKFRTHYEGNVLRSIVRRVLYSCSPTPVRPSGGVYFVPALHENKLKALNKVVGELENGEGFAVPMINTNENQDMVRSKLLENLTKVLIDTREAAEIAATGAKKKGELTVSLEQAKDVINAYQDYAGILSGDLNKMEDTVKGINTAVSDLFQAIAAMSKKN
ncbi:hypothetical protein LJR153_007354 [Paenibacillus sp. LjRoot153]|uniref:DUF6744 family protein n=1 Tax=Paenibacillus sp. LjRoot153 TaxID=3342270 RepID=UPI003ED0E5D1